MKMLSRDVKVFSGALYASKLWKKKFLFLARSIARRKNTYFSISNRVLRDLYTLPTGNCTLGRLHPTDRGNRVFLPCRLSFRGTKGQKYGSNSRMLLGAQGPRCIETRPTRFTVSTTDVFFIDKLPAAIPRFFKPGAGSGPTELAATLSSGTGLSNSVFRVAFVQFFHGKGVSFPLSWKGG